MPTKLSFEYVKNFINKENELISTIYNNNKELLIIKCKKCNENFKQCFSSYHLGHRCQKCANKINGLKGGISSSKKRYGNKISLKQIIRICKSCKKEYIPSRTEQKLCNMECAINYTQTEEYRQKGRINGSKGGQISAEKQQRRSKNEIACAELCIKYFGKDDILCNERIFKDKNDGLWDCDIFIKSIKIAILWDGFYYHHGPNVSKKQKARDKLKRKIILDNNCTYYTIIDKGKFNKQFVQEQFDLFIHKLYFKNVLNKIEKY